MNRDDKVLTKNSPDYKRRVITWSAMIGIGVFLFQAGRGPIGEAVLMASIIGVLGGLLAARWTPKNAAETEEAQANYDQHALHPAVGYGILLGAVVVFVAVLYVASSMVE